jgi:type I restriction enzyme M protein
MPRGTLTSSQGGDDTIRKAFLDDDVIECIIDLPGQLFFNTQIPSSLWFFNKDKSKWKSSRGNQVLFIDARKLGTAISRTQIEFSDAEIARLADTFNSWCDGTYEDVDGFCRSVTREEIAKNGDSLSPGRYIGTEEVESENQEDFSARLQSLTSELAAQFEKSNALQNKIQKILGSLNNNV